MARTASLTDRVRDYELGQLRSHDARDGAARQHAVSDTRDLLGALFQECLRHSPACRPNHDIVHENAAMAGHVAMTFMTSICPAARGVDNGERRIDALATARAPRHPRPARRP